MNQQAFGSRYNCYVDNLTTVKRMGNKYKISNVSCCRSAGLELAIGSLPEHTKKNSVNDSKLLNNRSRAKSKIQELALCNPWDFFCTLTIDSAKFDRYDFKSFYSKFSKFIFNMNRSRDSKIVYLLVPELHKDGAWHMHGLFHGLLADDLVKNEHGYLDWLAYKKRFGYISLAPVKSHEKVSSYIQKYITKDCEKSVTELGAHMYYASKGLKCADVLFKGRAELIGDWDWVHEAGYCRTAMKDATDHEFTDYLRNLEKL